MRVLVTNDDGIRAPGLAELASAADGEGHDVVVVAPLEDRSGWSAALGSLRPDTEIGYEAVPLPGLEEVAGFGLDGTPALAVLLSQLGAFGEPPGLVLSGINPGNNTGRAILHSGTVGAALTAATFGVSAVAVSIGAGESFHWATARHLAVLATRWIVRAPSGTVLNLNVPNLALADVVGVRPARLAPFGTIRTAVSGSGSGKLQVEMRASGADPADDTDTALVASGAATVTAIAGVRAVGEMDVAEWLERGLRPPAVPTH